jgi:hypothetical protein
MRTAIVQRWVPSCSTITIIFLNKLAFFCSIPPFRLLSWAI